MSTRMPAARWADAPHPHHVPSGAASRSNADWILPIASCMAASCCLSAIMYRRDAAELRPAVGLAAHGPADRDISRLLILYLAAALAVRAGSGAKLAGVAAGGYEPEHGVADAEPTATATRGVSRAQQVVAAPWSKTDFLARLRQVHDVIVFRVQRRPRTADRMTKLPRAGIGSRRRNHRPARATADAEAAKRPAPGSLGQAAGPDGTETRLGQALRQLIQTERGAPLSGVVVLSDGGQNAGISPEAAVELAAEAKIPIFTVGLGSDRQPANVRRQRFRRARPGLSRRSLHGDRLRAGPRNGRPHGHGASCLAGAASDTADAARRGTGAGVQSSRSRSAATAKWCR